MPKLDPNNVTVEAWDTMVSLRMWAIEMIVAAQPTMLLHDPVQLMNHAAALVDFVYTETIPVSVEASPMTDWTAGANYKLDA